LKASSSLVFMTDPEVEGTVIVPNVGTAYPVTQRNPEGLNL
jgi:hypothetical protein